MTPIRRPVRLALALGLVSWLVGCGSGTPATTTPRRDQAVVNSVASPAPSPLAAAATPKPATRPAGIRKPPATAPFSSSVSIITPTVRARMHRSWHPGCPVPLADLRYVRVSYWTFTGTVQQGELVLNKASVNAVVRALHTLYDLRFPIVRMRLIDPYAGGNSAALAADNTAAFNCRPATGHPGVWSQHSYGWAIDLNPVQNPYVGSGGAVEPPAARPYLDRSRRAPGMIHPGDAVVEAFAAVGWSWGGYWTSVQDYQHFSVNNR